jgi:hypothetical protein
MAKSASIKMALPVRNLTTFRKFGSHDLELRAYRLYSKDLKNY